MPRKKKKTMPQKRVLPVADTRYYQNLLLNPNIQAYLLIIRKGEGTLGPAGYYKHFGTGYLPTLDLRPPHETYKSISKKNGTISSSAVGAFQFLNSDSHPYWDEKADKFGWNDILPIHQEIAALDIIQGKNAIQDILNGNIISAINKTNGIWISLPGGKQDQPTQKLTDALLFYEENGGTLDNLSVYILDNSPIGATHRLARRIRDGAKTIALSSTVLGPSGWTFGAGVLMIGESVSKKILHAHPIGLKKSTVDRIMQNNSQDVTMHTAAHVVDKNIAKAALQKAADSLKKSNQKQNLPSYFSLL